MTWTTKKNVLAADASAFTLFGLGGNHHYFGTLNPGIQADLDGDDLPDFTIGNFQADLNGYTDNGAVWLLTHLSQYFDDDGDGYAEFQGTCQDTLACPRPLEGDCDDTAVGIHPDAPEVCADHIDQDCDGADLPCANQDQDGDGYAAAGGDCDDTRSSIHPGAPELLDGQDNDCDGSMDEGLPETDDDKDGYSDVVGDCNDSAADPAAPAMYPGNAELPDQLDNDCDGTVDETTVLFDDDADGYSEQAGDCDDTRAEVYPNAPEGPDANGDAILEGDDIDNNCDGKVDEGTELFDDDLDGFNELEGDCDDTNSAVAPDQTDIAYDGIDQDCDGADFVDVDGDGFASVEVGGQDCDDSSAAIFPNATEYCGDALDQNCDGIDAVCAAVDRDGDGYAPTDASGAPVDCNDEAADIHPGAVEDPTDGLDNNCDGQVDEVSPTPIPSAGGCNCSVEAEAGAPSSGAGGLIAWGLLASYWLRRRRIRLPVPV